MATIENIGAILEGIEPSAVRPSTGEIAVERRALQAPVKWLARIFAARDRRKSSRHFDPPLMAFYWDGGIPVPHAVSDISRTGLFLKTADRWQSRTLLRVTLQRRADVPVQPGETITLQCRVVRTGDDGVGVAFIPAEGLHNDGSPGVGRLATRKELDRFLQRVMSDAIGVSTHESPYPPFSDLAPDRKDSRAVAPHSEDMDEVVERKTHAS